MKYAIITMLCVAYAVSAHAQLVYKSYDWAKTPVYHTLSESETSKDVVILKDKTIIEYAYEDNELTKYSTLHSITHVSGKEALEQYNKLYISNNDVIDVISVKVRTIDKNGKVTISNSNNLKQADDVANEGSYKMMPVEGLEQGDEVEVLYTLKEHPSYFGMHYFQDNILTKNISYEIYSPSNLKYEMKSYNGLKDPVYDTLNSKNHVIVSADVVEGIKEDKYMGYRAYVQKVAYQLNYNYSNGSARLFTYDLASARFYKMLAVPLKEETPAVKSFIKKMDIKGLTGEALIRKVELYFKKNIVIDKSLSDEKGEFNNIVKLKAASPFMFTRMFCLIFDQLDVPYQIVITSDRLNKPFDPDFECWSFLDNTMLYFPDADKYMAPDEFESRLGFMPYSYMGQKGLFIKGIDIGGFKSGIGKIKDIPYVSADQSHHATNITMDLSKPGSETKANVKVELLGYLAYGIQAVYEYVPDDKKSTLTDPYLKVTGDEAKLTDVQVTNGNATDALVKPMLMQATLSDETLVEHAGNKLLLKAGMLIGKQEEMYENKTRTFPADIYFVHSLIRKIEIKLPDGYTVSNPEACNIHAVCPGTSDKPMAEFTSSYSIDGNSFIINCVESYNELTYPMDKFEAFRQVINASADFNKITLVISKK